MYEIRAGVCNYIKVRPLVLCEDINLIDLYGIDKISPFIGVQYVFDFTQYTINIEHLKMIGKEIAKPLRNDNSFYYLPMQYINDYNRRPASGRQWISFCPA